MFVIILYERIKEKKVITPMRTVVLYLSRQNRNTIINSMTISYQQKNSSDFHQGTLNFFFIAYLDKMFLKFIKTTEHGLSSSKLTFSRLPNVMDRGRSMRRCLTIRKRRMWNKRDWLAQQEKKRKGKKPRKDF